MQEWLSTGLGCESSVLGGDVRIGKTTTGLSDFFGEGDG